jgi:hypothetical protein
MLLLALVLVATPANPAFAEVDAQTEHVPDELVTQIAVATPPATPAHKSLVTRRETRPPASPALSRVFRPPRPSFG